MLCYKCYLSWIVVKCFPHLHWSFFEFRCIFWSVSTWWRLKNLDKLELFTQLDRKQFFSFLSDEKLFWLHSSRVIAQLEIYFFHFQVIFIQIVMYSWLCLAVNELKSLLFFLDEKWEFLFSKGHRKRTQKNENFHFP